jgi:hypothetical protein
MMVAQSFLNIRSVIQDDLAQLAWDQLFDNAERRWTAVIDQLIEFGTWKADWDNEGAPAPNKDAVSGAIGLVNHFLALLHENQADKMPPPSRVLPTIDGTILFEWQFPGSYMELDVRGKNEADGMILRKGVINALHSKVTW